MRLLKLKGNVKRTVMARELITAMELKTILLEVTKCSVCKWRKRNCSCKLVFLVCTFTAFMLMQTGWIQASGRVTRRLACDPTCLLLSPSLNFPIKNKQNLKVLKSRRQYNLYLIYFGKIVFENNYGNWSICFSGTNASFSMSFSKLLKIPILVFLHKQDW